MGEYTPTTLEKASPYMRRTSDFVKSGDWACLMFLVLWVLALSGSVIGVGECRFP